MNKNGIPEVFPIPTAAFLNRRQRQAASHIYELNCSWVSYTWVISLGYNKNVEKRERV